MMMGKEDLCLSLSLRFPDQNHHQNYNFLQLKLHKPSSLAPTSSASAAFVPPNSTCNNTFPFQESSTDPTRTEARSFLRGIDVNRRPPTADCEEEAGVSSPNSTISSASGKRSEREYVTSNNGEEHEAERSCSRGISDEEDGGDTSRKKLRLSKDQSAVLEESFKEHHTLNPSQKMALAKQLGLRPRQVEVWFQNRRARTKLKQTEVDCEFLKRCCENLTEENRRLQKEVQELRALKLSPQFYMHMTPPTTLTMCSSCERVAVPPSSTTVDPRMALAQSSQMRQAHHHRSIPINPWAGPLAHGVVPFDALRTRS